MNISVATPTSLRRAESALDALDAEFGAPGASQELGCCKHQSSSHVAGGGAARIGQNRPRRACRGEPPGARNSPQAGPALKGAERA
jgi:hypothetical protein